MGNTFFVEKPELLAITNGSEKRPEMDYFGVEYNVLYFVYEGSIQVLLDEQMMNVFEGQMLLIDGQEAHRQLRGDCAGYYKITAAHIVPYQDIWNTCESDKGQKYRVFELAEEQEICRFICERMLSESLTDHPSMEIVDSYLECILSIIWRILTKNYDHQMGFVSSAKNYIEKHFKDNITLSEIAEYVNVSVYHLAHTFKDVMEISPIQYAIQCRMDYAKKQLVESNLSIHKIALELGYDNPNYFNLLFKKMVGISPGKYRKIFRRGK